MFPLVPKPFIVPEGLGRERSRLGILATRDQAFSVSGSSPLLLTVKKGARCTFLHQETICRNPFSYVLNRYCPPLRVSALCECVFLNYTLNLLYSSLGHIQIGRIYAFLQ